MTRRRERVEASVAQLAADFLARAGAVKALVTVTRVRMSDDYREATVFLSVLPVAMESEAVRSAKRARSDLREYMRKHSRLHPAPTVDFELDYGEKNRQRIDDLTRS